MEPVAQGEGYVAHGFCCTGMRIGSTWILWHREKDKFHMDSVAQGEG
jgi:hypothetical protein